MLLQHISIRMSFAHGWRGRRRSAWLWERRSRCSQELRSRFNALMNMGGHMSGELKLGISRERVEWDVMVSTWPLPMQRLSKNKTPIQLSVTSFALSWTPRKRIFYQGVRSIWWVAQCLLPSLSSCTSYQQIICSNAPKRTRSNRSKRTGSC